MSRHLKASWPRVARAAAAIAPPAIAAAASYLGSPLVWAVSFPGILFAAMFAGPLWGSIAGAGCIAVFALTEQSGRLVLALFAVSAAAQITIAVWFRRDLLERQRLSSRLLRLLDVSREFVLFADREGKPLAPIPAFAELTGLDWQDYAGHGWLEAIHPDDRAQLPFRTSARGKVHHVELRVRDAKGEWRWHRMHLVPVPDQEGNVVEWLGTLGDIHEHKLAAEQRELVLGDTRHRLKNLMAIIEGLAKYSAPRRGEEPAVDQFLDRFLGRLRALTAAGDAVLSTGNVAVEARAAIHEVLAPFADEIAERIHIDGPELLLSEQLGGGLTMAVHELATNAIKYGALSVAGGKVHFIWSVRRDQDREHIHFDWKERGGPPPVPPAREGFGTRMIKSVTQREPEGQVRLEYEPDGLRCHIRITRAA